MIIVMPMFMSRATTTMMMTMAMTMMKMMFMMLMMLMMMIFQLYTELPSGNLSPGSEICGCQEGGELKCTTLEEVMTMTMMMMMMMMTTAMMVIMMMMKTKEDRQLKCTMRRSGD